MAEPAHQLLFKSLHRNLKLYSDRSGQRARIRASMRACRAYCSAIAV